MAFQSSIISLHSIFGNLRSKGLFTVEGVGMLSIGSMVARRHPKERRPETSWHRQTPDQHVPYWTFYLPAAADVSLERSQVLASLRPLTSGHILVLARSHGLDSHCHTRKFCRSFMLGVFHVILMLGKNINESVVGEGQSSATQTGGRHGILLGRIPMLDHFNRPSGAAFPVDFA